MSVEVGTAYILCDDPDCRAKMPVVVTAELNTHDDGRQYLDCEPDMTDMWAHYWTHRGVEGG